METAPITLTVRGPHNTGRTTLARLVEEALREHGYTDVRFRDQPPLPHDQKPDFQERFPVNQQRPILIVVETVGG